MTEDEEVKDGKRGHRRGQQEAIIDNVIRTYYPTYHLHVCTRQRCRRAGLGYKLCGPEYGDLTPAQQSLVDAKVGLELGRGGAKFNDSMVKELAMLTAETEVFRIQKYRGQSVESFCDVSPENIGKGIVHETTCDTCSKEAR